MKSSVPHSGSRRLALKLVLSTLAGRANRLRVWLRRDFERQAAIARRARSGHHP
jgi:hypothetical protein